MRWLGLVGALALALGGCGGDGGVPDAGEADDAGAGGRDAGPLQCPVGQHVCGGGCVDDLPNEPENGCRLGCGEACEVPTGGVAACSDEGECTLGCEPPFVAMDGTCVCEAQTCEDLGATCGAPDGGCGAPLDCGTCEGGAVCLEPDFTCGCALDDAEPNDSFRQADMNDLLADVPNEDWSQSYSEFGISSPTDTDVFRLRVADSGAFNGDPVIRVTLSDIPAGSNYDLSATWSCDGSPNRSTCTAGMPTTERGVTCDSTSSGTTSETVEITVECRSSVTTNTDDSGTLYVRVIPVTDSGSCAPYRLDIDIQN